MKRFFFLLVLLTATAGSAVGEALERSAPEDEGVRSRDVAELLDGLMTLPYANMHGVMVLRHGRVIGEAWNAPFKASYGHAMYSVSKTFTAACVGLCVQDSLLNLDDQVAQFFLDELPAELTDTLKSLTVKDLLTMQSGLPVNYTKLRKDSTCWTRALLGQQMVAWPGTLFAYDSMDSYLLSGIVQRLTGRTALELLEERVFDPMGVSRAAWERSPEGVCCGGWGLYLRLEDMAKFGQLLLNRGRWKDRQLLAEEWVDAMTARQVADGAGNGYGYQMWMTSRPGVVKADGAYGQYIYVVPDKDMVIVMTQNHVTSGTANLGATEWLMVCRLLDKVGDDMLMKGEDYATLKKKQKSYHMPYTNGAKSSPKHMTLYSVPVTLQLADNMLGWETVRMSQKRTGELKLTITTTDGQQYAMLCGNKSWLTSKIKGKPLTYADRRFQGQFSGLKGPFYVGASYGWYGSGVDDLYVRLHYVNWISGARIHFHFSGSSVTAVKIRPAYSTKDISVTVLQSH